MIRIDEIYDNVFAPSIINKPDQSMHYFDPFGRTDAEALQVKPLITHRDKAFLFWDQEPYFPEVHNPTVKWFDDTFIVNNKTKTEVTFITSEKDSTNVNELCQTHGFKSNYYFFHGWAALDWFRGYNRCNLILQYSERDITNTFISPNRVVGGNRTHRLALFKQMAKHNLLENNKVSFPKYCPYSGEEVSVNGVNLPLVFASEDANNIPNESYKISLWEESKNSLLQVVTETVYEQSTLHLTEKVFKPIVMQMPFVLVGAKHNLEYLRSYGFKTFNEFWDESYDDMDNDQRINAVTKLLTDLNSLSIKEKAHLQKHLVPVVEHNFNWFYSQEFENLLWKELTDMMKQW